MIRELFCRLTGYRYHYRLNLKYRTEDRRTIGDVTLTAVVTSPAYMNQSRELKKALAHNLIRHIPKGYLCNGELIAEPIMYLGFFKAQHK